MKNLLPHILLAALLFTFTQASPAADSDCRQLLRRSPLAPGESAKLHHAKSSQYMITTQGDYSSAAGELMYQFGGNAVDAAVAISFTISVERPQSTGIGGGGFMLIKTPEGDLPEAWDFREKAPLSADAKMFLDQNGDHIVEKSRVGIHAAGVPGLVAGALEIHAKYGKLPLERVLSPAIDLAERGFPIYPELARALQAKQRTLEKFPSSRKIFFREGKVLKEGDLLVQADLAKTLRKIARHGRQGFYGGLVAKAIARQGRISRRDLRAYDVKLRPAIRGSYKGREVFSMGSPSSGGIHLLQILNIAENFNLKKLGPQHPRTVHLIASAMQQAFADRAKYLGDADFVEVPVERLISKRYASEIARKITSERARVQADVPLGEFESFESIESDETTHFSLMDKDGWAISSTQTLNGYFGSGLVVEGTGILLNNEMDDFAAKEGASNLFGAVGGKQNLIAPQKRPLSSMSPTIVMEKGAPILTLGTPAGTRIFTCVAQIVLNYLEHGLSLADAVAAVRYHHQWFPDEIRIDSPGLPPKTEAALKKMGHVLRTANLNCRIQAVARTKGGKFIGVSDIRGRGRAGGR